MRSTRFASLAMLGLTGAIQLSGCSCDPRGPGAPSEERVVALPLRGQECQQELLGNGGWWELEQVGVRGERPRAARTLDRLCTYRWIGRTAGAPPDARPFSTSLFEDASEQHPVVRALGPASSTLTDLLDRARQNLETQAEANPLSQAPVGYQKVWVGFPDTSRSTGSDPEDTIPLGTSAGSVMQGNPHAFNVAWINRYLTCPSADRCLTTPRFELALENGDRGTIKHFADAIRRLVDDWVRVGKPAGHPLILNVAAGWEPAYDCVSRLPQFGGPSAAALHAAQGQPSKDLAPGLGERPSEAPGAASAKGDPGAKSDRDKLHGRKASASTVPFAGSIPECDSVAQTLGIDTQAVLTEIEIASCHGALVIVAAGNNPLVSPQRRGPMLPAAWETLPAPDSARCGELIGSAAPFASDSFPSAYRPLLYAAGGVNDNDSPIVLTRADGVARLVAPASLLAAFPSNRQEGGYASTCGMTAGGNGFVASNTGPCDHNYPMTGTSVASAVVSAAAAAVWAYHPTWDAHHVMNVVYANGAALDPVLASFSLGTAALGLSTEAVHRVSICRAAQASIREGSPLSSLGCRDDDSTRPFNGLTNPDPYLTALTGNNALDLTSPRGQVDPQPGWPCPECRAHLPGPSEDMWTIDGAIPFDAWSALGATGLRVWGDTGSTPAFSSSLQVVLLDANGRAIAIEGDDHSGFSSTLAPPRDHDNGLWYMPQTGGALQVYGQFRPARGETRPVAHVVVQFQKQSSATSSWSSAAEEITIR